MFSTFTFCSNGLPVAQTDSFFNRNGPFILQPTLRLLQPLLLHFIALDLLTLTQKLTKTSSNLGESHKVSSFVE
jgi:hypothetical protein